jgi:hypothetical protein
MALHLIIFSLGPGFRLGPGLASLEPILHRRYVLLPQIGLASRCTALHNMMCCARLVRLLPRQDCRVLE